MSIPLAKPNPAKLSESLAQLREMEDRAIFSNFGPLTTDFERNITDQLFGGIGESLTVCNATIGLMLAIRQVIDGRPKSRRRYALMPSFTFAAAAQAAQWNRLTPLFCDINPSDWSADPASEQRLLEQYGDQIAVIVPYATFGYDIDLARYEKLQQQYDIPVVVDAAASLGTISRDGQGFGAGFSGAVVYSMHVTKSFSTAEGGLIYSADPQLIRTLRSMSNFGFSEPRNASLMGLNGKMSEVAALLASLRLETFDAVMQHRSHLVALYREGLPELTFQPVKIERQAHQFTPVLLPRSLAPLRDAIQYEMRQLGVASATYFSPHVAEQDYFRAHANLAALPVTNDVASRVLTLPLYDTMTDEEAQQVIATVKAALAAVDRRQNFVPRRSSVRPGSERRFTH
jgi:dTDP-4-amino-4,6-dideoxygalactose transaminase